MSSDVAALFDLGWKLLLVLGLAVLSARVLRWLSGPGMATASLLKVLARHPLGPQQSLVLIAVGKKRLLVGQTPQRLTLLAELSDEDLANDDERAAADGPGSVRQRTLFDVLPRAGADGLLGKLGWTRRDRSDRAISPDPNESTSIAAFAAALQAATRKAGALAAPPRDLFSDLPSRFHVSLADGGVED